MGQQETARIERSFASAGWDIDGSFAGYLVIGYSGENLSVVAHQEAWDTDGPVFELFDHQRNVSYWVREVPAPRDAALLLEEHGEPPEE